MTGEVEVPLAGGDVTAGVVRVGETVRRPTGPHSPLVHAMLEHLERVGFAGAPRYLGQDDRGREMLTYIEGEVAGRPWPDWVTDERRVASVARLVRTLDDAMVPMGLPGHLLPDEVDPEGAPRPVGPAPTFVGHRDVTPENVVFRDGEAVGLIDFDLAQPVSRVDEVCNVLLWWAPLMPPEDRQESVREVDAIARAALIVDAYDLDDAGRAAVVAVAQRTAERSWFLMRRRALRDGGGWARMWGEGVGDRILRRQQWLRDNAESLGDALTRR
ncbi:MAG: phosphotransferase [Candidatus Nanopelagicales bacterium]